MDKFRIVPLVVVDSGVVVTSLEPFVVVTVMMVVIVVGWTEIVLEG